MFAYCLLDPNAAYRFNIKL